MTVAERVNFVDEFRHAPAYRLDTPNCKGWIRPAYKLAGAWATMSAMELAEHIQQIRASLRSVMAEKGVKPTTLSLKVGNSKTLVKELLEDNNDVKLGTLLRLADALEVPLERLMGAPADATQPSASVLTSAFATLLESVGISPYEDERARKLALRFPDALRRASNLHESFVEAGGSDPEAGAPALVGGRPEA